MLASGPSTARITSATVISSAARASQYPPLAPRRARTSRACFSSSRMCSRNCRGISWASASCSPLTGSLSGAAASSTRRSYGVVGFGGDPHIVRMRSRAGGPSGALDRIGRAARSVGSRDRGSRRRRGGDVAYGPRRGRGRSRRDGCGEGGRDRVRPGGRDVVRAPVLPTTCTCSATGWIWTRSPPPAIGPSRSESTVPGRSSNGSTPTAWRSPSRHATAEAGAADSIGRPHIARAAGAGPGDLGPFFEEYLVPGAKAFVSRRWPSAEEAVELIHAAGGVAVVAHPYWDVSEPEPGARPGREPEARRPGRHRDVLPPAHEGADRSLPRALPGFDLVPTGSSDFHGPTHKTFSRFGAYDTYGLGEPEVPVKP